MGNDLRMIVDRGLMLRKVLEISEHASKKLALFKRWRICLVRTLDKEELRHSRNSGCGIS